MAQHVTTSARQAREPAPPAPYRWRWAALFAILGVEVMDLLDALVTNIAAPSVRADLGGTATLTQWLGAAYTLAMAIGLLTGGRLGDLFGRKRMFLVGTAGFTTASLLCSIAQTPETLIAARVLQGLFGAVVLPQGLGMIKSMFPPKEMAAAFGAFGPVMGLSSVGGPLLAGALIDANLWGSGWRSIFLINLPIGLAIVAAALRYLPGDGPRSVRSLDLVGAALAACAAAALVYPLVQGRELDWPAWTFGLIGLSVLLFGALAWHERRTAARGGSPLLEPSIFRKRAFAGGLVTGLVFFSALIGFSLVFTLYIQLGRGYSPLGAGLAGSPMAVGTVIGFIAAGAVLAEKFGRRLIHAGLVVMAAGSAGLLATIHYGGTGGSVWRLAPTLAVVGIGMGLSMAPFFDIVLAGVEATETGTAGGALTAVQQLGGALGIAVLGTVFFAALGGHIATRSADAVPALRQQLAAAGVPAAQQEPIARGLRECGRDRAVAKDPVAVPPSCARAEGAVRAAAASPQGPAIVAAVQAAATKAVERGFSDALQIALLVQLGALAAAFGLAFALPKRARHEEGVLPAG